MEEWTRTDAERPVREGLQPSEESALGPRCHWNRENSTQWTCVGLNSLQLPFCCSKNRCLSAVVCLGDRFGKTWCFVGYKRWRRRSQGERLVFRIVQKTMPLTEMEKQEESRFGEIYPDSHLGQFYEPPKWPLSHPRMYVYTVIWNQRQALG